MSLRKIFFLIFVLSFYFSCKKERDNQYIIPKNDSVISKNDSVILKIKTSKRYKEWGFFLNRIDEPILKNKNKIIFRLIILNTLPKSVEIFKIEKQNNFYYYISKKLIEVNNKDSLLIIANKKLSKEKWNEFVELTDNLNFWQLPVKINKRGLDGSTYILESYMPNRGNVTNREYHTVSRWNPIGSTSFKKICLKLMNYGNDTQLGNGADTAHQAQLAHE